MFFVDAILPLAEKGYCGTALDRAIAETSGVLLPAGATRSPYIALSDEDMKFLRTKMVEDYPALIYRK